MKIYKGTIISVDKEDGIYHYLAEDKGRIIFVGDKLPEELKKYEIIDLKHRALMPAFTDTHCHFASYAMLSSMVKLNKAGSNARILEILKREDAKLPKNKTLLGFGVSPKVEEGRLIEKEEIDRAVKDRKVVLISEDGHTAVMNTAALDFFKDILSCVRGYDYQSGILRNEAFYRAADNLLKILSIKDVLNSLQSAIDGYITKGFSSVHAMCGSGSPKDIDVDILRWLARGQDSGFQMRIFIQSFDTEKAKKRGLPRLGGCFKTALDGSITSRDAALLRPYESTDNKGVLYYTDEELFEYLDRINRAGLQIEMHAIGDAAFEQGTKTLKKVLDAYPRKDHRHGLIHCSLITEEGIKICKDYGIQILAQPAFIDMSLKSFDFMYSALGTRIYDAEPHNLFLENGIMLSAGSDAPVTEPDPIEWIYKACNNPNTAHRLTLSEAIRISTYNGSYAAFDEKERGSLEAGKIADMVILNNNPYALHTEDLNTLTVESTILGGKPYEPRKKNIFLTILKGMLKKGKV